MSNKTLDKALKYAGIAGVLTAAIRQLLIADDLPKKDVAKLLVELIEEDQGYVKDIMQLKEDLKQKYNL